MGAANLSDALTVLPARAPSAGAKAAHAAAETAAPRTATTQATQLASEADPTRPVTVKLSKSPGPNAVPRGPREKIHPKDNSETRRSATRENEAADTLAKRGHDVEQKPKVPGTKKRPDYRINGEIFDCYAPAHDTSTRAISSAIERKVKKGQADRIVLNLDDWGGNVEDMQKQLATYPIEGLKEVKVVKGGVDINIYP